MTMTPSSSRLPVCLSRLQLQPEAHHRYNEQTVAPRDVMHTPHPGSVGKEQQEEEEQTYGTAANTRSMSTLPSFLPSELAVERINATVLMRMRTRAHARTHASVVSRADCAVHVVDGMGATISILAFPSRSLHPLRSFARRIYRAPSVPRLGGNGPPAVSPDQQNSDSLRRGRSGPREEWLNFLLVVCDRSEPEDEDDELCPGSMRCASCNETHPPANGTSVGQGTSTQRTLGSVGVGDGVRPVGEQLPLRGYPKINWRDGI
ncbi:hypothetical protein BDW22DRAFT_1418710 [Trametopsis cervina]|nr:hypothetical protein BDW22DRAFT_1418710 [Trametopsis cervina]